MIAETHLKDAFLICDQMRASGATQADITRALEGVLRAALPGIQAREYDCHVCADSGVEVLNCAARKCHRRAPHGPHEYVIPCFCSAGERWKAKPQTVESAINAAARTAKPKPFTRFGR